MADGVIAFSVFSGRRGGIREGKLGKEDDHILPRVCFFWEYKYGHHAAQGITFTHRKTKWVSPQKTQRLVPVSTWDHQVGHYLNSHSVLILESSTTV